MNLFRVAVFALTISGTVTPCAAADATAAQEVGMVVDYSPARGAHTIKRQDGSLLPVKLGTLVMAGDLVQVTGSGRVFVQLNDGTQRDVGPGEWRVPDAKPLGAVASLLRSLPRLLDVQARIAASASTRGGEMCDGDDAGASIEAPILRAQSKVSAGKQNVALGWFGGCAPFDVVIRHDGTVIAQGAALKRRQHQFVDLDLAAGLYELRITDAAGRAQRYGIEAVAVAPTPPVDFEATDSATATIARALWLAELDHGSWRLEAFKTLRPLMAQRERIAGLIGDYLLVSSATESGEDNAL